MRLVPYLALASLMCACQNPFLHDYVQRDPPTDSFGCAPNASADELSGEATPDGIVLSWTSAAVNEDGFIVERSVANSPAWLEVGRSGSDELTLTDIGAVPDTDYIYRVRSYRVVDTEDCISSPSGSIAQTSAPLPPDSLTATPLSSTSVEISWTDLNTHPSIRYHVMRRVAAQAYVDVGAVDAPTTTFLDTALSTAITYDYAISAVSAAGEGSPSEVSVVPWQHPILSWDGEPALDPTCVLDASGTAVIAPGTDATFESASGMIERSSGAVGADENGISGVLDDLSPGQFNIEWTVNDDFNGSSSLSRTLELSSSVVGFGRFSSPRLGQVSSGGRQVLYTGCAECTGEPGLLTTGDFHSCVIANGGELQCWGWNFHQQLGIGNVPDGTSLVPQVVCAGPADDPCSANLTDVSVLALGIKHSCTVLSSGEMRCWGSNGAGQLGDGGRTDRYTPVPVCATGAGNACANLTGATAVAVGYDHTCAILGPSAEVHCWGDNERGQLGNGHGGEGASSNNPTAVCLSGSVRGGDCVPLTGATAVGAGEYFSCAALSSGETRCWGSSSSGTLGSDPADGLPNPQRVCRDSSCTAFVDDFASLTMGDVHQCGLTAAGEVYCWGSGGSGRLGNGSTELERFPARVCANGSGPGCPSLTGVQSVYGGGSFTCALLDSGEATCWGYNSSGALGNGDSDRVSQRNPSPVCRTGDFDDGDCVPLTGITAMAVGDGHACAIVNDGGVWCWGYGYWGQLGNGLFDSNNVNPVQVCLSGSTWDGTICDNGTGTHTPFTNASALAAGEDFTCIVDGNRDVWCTGRNADGQLGDGGAASYSEWPVFAFAGADSIHAGLEFACARSGADVWCWGDDTYGQLGNGTGPSASPALVCASGAWDGAACAGGAPLQVAELGVGRFSACARGPTDEVVCWGLNSGGQLGDGTVGGSNGVPSPACATGTAGTCVPLVSSNLSVGGRRVCVRDDATNELRCWGDISSYPLGTDHDDRSAYNPSLVCESGSGSYCSPMIGATALAGSDDSMCALMSTGAVRCWGYASYGEHGDGDWGTRRSPSMVCDTGVWDGTTCAGGTPMTGATQISAAVDHVCAVVGTEPRCWGSNSSGMLGDETGSSSYNPMTPCSPTGCANGPLTNVARIAAGDDHTCARLTDGSTYCWGDNDEGQLGNNDTAETRLPVAVCDPSDPVGCPALGGTELVGAGGGLSCATEVGTGDTRCWGDTLAGAGLTRVVSNLAPVCFDGDPLNCQPLDDVVSAAAGTSHTCAVRGDGAVWCWGNGYDGQLGHGISLTDFGAETVAQPQRVCTAGAFDGTLCTDDGVNDTALTNAVSVTAGGAYFGSLNVPGHACALTADGRAWCWGWNEYGQLGNGAQSAGFGGTPLAGPVVCNNGPGAGPGCPGPGPLQDIVALEAGPQHTCAILNTGDLKCWGSNEYGQMGDGRFGSGERHTVPTDVDLAGARVIDVALGYEFTCAVLDTGRVACWGRNRFGTVGNGLSGYAGTGAPQEPLPGFVCRSGSGATCLPLEDIIDVDAGSDSACALDVNGGVWCWGWGEFSGKLGNGVFGDDYLSPNPVSVCEPAVSTDCSAVPSGCTPLTGAISISVGDSHACVIRDTGEALCWGDATLGQRGDGLSSDTVITISFDALGQCEPTPVCSADVVPCATGGNFTDAQIQTCDVIGLSVP